MAGKAHAVLARSSFEEGESEDCSVQDRVNCSELTVRRNAVSEKTSLTKIMPTSDKDWCADVTNYPGAVLVFFAAAWCGPCKQLKAVVETVAEKHSNLKVVEYDVDAEQGQTIAYGVRGIPTLILFKSGSRAETVTGYQSVASVERMLARHLDKAA